MDSNYHAGMVADFEPVRTVEVPLERLAGWLDRFTLAHGETTTQISPDAIDLRAADGARARLVNRWEPLASGIDTDTALAHLARPRTIALLLVRKAASAVGIAEGADLVAHRVSRHYVQSRTKAGGWSQQRYARRRDNQTRSAFEDAADDAFEVLVPQLGRMEALVTGGDKVGVAAVLADPRLAGLAALPNRHRLLPVGDARLTVLADALTAARSVPIELDAQAIARPQRD